MGTLFSRFFKEPVAPAARVRVVLVGAGEVGFRIAKRLAQDGKEVVVRPGDICATGYGQHHGLENRSNEPVELIALIACE